MAARILVLKDQIDAALRDEKQPWTRILAETEFRTGVNRLYLFLGNVFDLIILALILDATGKRDSGVGMFPDTFWLVSLC